MRNYGLNRSSLSRYMSRSSFKRSSIGRRNTYKVSNSTFKSYLAEAKKIAEEIETEKSFVASQTARTKAKTYSATGSSFNNGIKEMSESTGDINSILSKDEPELEKAYDEAVKFADGYNDMLSAVHGASGSSIASKARYITDLTNIFSRALGNIGISTDKYGKLCVDKEKFLNADIKDIEKIFHGKTSFASLIKEQTDSISVLSAMSAETYSGSGTSAYTSAMSGSIFSKLL